MDAKTLAAALNGREYGDEIEDDEEERAKADGLVVVFGYSDDLVEFRGAINDEVGYGEEFIQFGKDGLIPIPDEDEREVLEKFGVLAQATKKGARFEADYRQNWSFTVPFPHETFDIMEDGELYCRGFVFKLSDALPA